MLYQATQMEQAFTKSSTKGRHLLSAPLLSLDAHHKNSNTDPTQTVTQIILSPADPRILHLFMQLTSLRRIMDYTAHKFEPAEFSLLEKTLIQKAKYLSGAGLADLLPIFNIGDRVGFIYGTGPNDHATGVIIASQRFALIKTDDGKTYNISPFALFALPKV